MKKSISKDCFDIAAAMPLSRYAIEFPFCGVMKLRGGPALLPPILQPRLRKQETEDVNTEIECLVESYTTRCEENAGESIFWLHLPRIHITHFADSGCFKWTNLLTIIYLQLTFKAYATSVLEYLLLKVAKFRPTTLTRVACLSLTGER